MADSDAFEFANTTNPEPFEDMTDFVIRGFQNRRLSRTDVEKKEATAHIHVVV